VPHNETEQQGTEQRRQRVLRPVAAVPQRLVIVVLRSASKIQVLHLKCEQATDAVVQHALRDLCHALLLSSSTLAAELL
jgi:hypothetical protein